MNNIVYIIYASQEYEGSWVHSVYKNKQIADKIRYDLEITNPDYLYYVSEEKVL
jgi:hypothetical protein